MTTDNRMNEPTPEQVEAAALAMHRLPVNIGGGRGFSYYVEPARAALEAAQGAAPQAESDYFPTPGKRLTPEFRADIVEAARDRIQAVWADVPEGVDALTLAQNIVMAQEFFWLSLHFQVSPSSTAPQASKKSCGPCRRGQHGCCDGNEYLRCECSHGAAPVPSSGVDEDALRPFLKNLIFQYNQERVTLKTATRYLAEWLKGQGDAARE